MFGSNFLQILQKDNIDTTNVTFTETSPTSVATILVDTTGRNAIAVNFGATLELAESDVDFAIEAIKQSKILVTTRMVNEAVALHSLKVAKENGCELPFFLFCFKFLIIFLFQSNYCFQFCTSK
jgi:sugar/nucleoside kinase (ribokinase family)